MIYIFDKTQAIIKVLTNDDFTAAHLNFKINTATTFEFSLPASKALPSGSKYVATPHPLNDSKFIMLRLTERVDNTETIDYSAYELAYQELATDGYIEDKRPQNQSALNLMKIALDGSNWELNNVNVSGIATTNFYYVDRLSAISKVVDMLGGEIVFYIEIQGNAISGRYMDYLARQGADKSKVFASGSNLLTVERQSDTSNIYTAILPRGKGEEIDNGKADTPDGYGRRINIADVEWKKSAGKPLDKPKGSIILLDPDATAEWGQINGNARLLPQTYDDIDDVNVLINSAYKTLQSVNHPQIQYSATVADVGGLSLGDTVLIMHGDRDLSYKTRVFEVKYDLLSPDQTELSLGDDLSSNSITSQLNNLNAVADTTSSQTQWTINQIGRPGTTYGATAPDSQKVGDIWFKYLPDGGTEIYRWNGDIWELLASPTTADDIADAVTDAVTQAKAHTDEVKQGLVSDISTAASQAASQANAAASQAYAYTDKVKQGLSTDISTAASQAASLASTAQQNAIDVASKSLGTYLVRLLPGTNIFKTTNSTTIQVQVWKAGQDITSTLDNASFSWKIAKDGTAAISLTNNVKNVTAKTSDFNSTGTYIVNVIIPVTDTTGTTRNQTFSDSTTIAKVTDGQDGANGQNGATGAPGNGISSTTITYAASASGTNAPTSGYTSTIPTVNKGQFLWQRTANSYTNGTTKNSDIATYFAKDGLNGVDGMDGGQGMIAQPSKPTSGLIDGFLWLDTSQTYPVYYIYDSSIKDFKIYQFNAKNINADQIKAKFVGTDRLSASQIIADDLHVQSANIDGKLTASQITVSSTNGSQTSLANFNLGEMSQNISDTKSAVNNLGQVNQLFNTEFSPDFLGWTTSYRWQNGVASDDYSFLLKEDWKFNSSNIMAYIIGNSAEIISEPLPYNKSSGSVAASAYIANGHNDGAGGTTNDGVVALRIVFYDANKNEVGRSLGNTVVSSATMTYVSDYMTPPDATAYVAINLGYTGTKGSARVSQPMLVFNSTSTGSYVPGNYNNNAALTQVKITADGISTFVRDSSGNLSSGFQTALSKTSLITGSTLASSIQTQTSSQISSALRDNNGKIISLINQDTSGVQISGKNITLDGNTTFTALQQTVNNLGQINQLINTEFSPDLQGWYREGENELENSFLSLYRYKYIQSNVMRIDTSQTSKRIINGFVPVNSDTVISFSSYAKVETGYAGAVAIRINFYDSGKNWVGSSNGSTTTNSTAMVYIKQENILIPSGVSYISLGISFSSYNSYVYISKPMLVFDSKIGNYSSGNYNNNAALAQVKNTADSLSSFVRDSSGNLSSNFQTALSKTSIITGSTLATSIQTQTSSQISSAITDNNGKIISLINQDSSGVQIAGKNIVLNGDTTVTGTFKVSQANIANGAIGTAQIGDASITSAKIANIDVSKLVGDTITGFTFNVNKNMNIIAGGKINAPLNSSVWDFTGNPYYYTNNGTTKSPWWKVQQQGAMAIDTSGTLHFDGSLTANDVSIGSTPQYAYYTQTGTNTLGGTNKLNVSMSLGLNGLRIDQQDARNAAATGGYVFVTGHGLFTGYDQANPRFSVQSNGNVMANNLTFIGGFDYRQIVGTTTATSNIYQLNVNGGRNLYMDGGQYVRIASTGGVNSGSKLYVTDTDIQLLGGGSSSNDATMILRVGKNNNNYMYYETQKTGSGGSALYMASDGAIIAHSSATKYKTDITYDKTSSLADRLMTVDLASWNDKEEERMRQNYKKLGTTPDYAIDLDGARYVGLIAEDLVKADLEEFVVRNVNTGSVESIRYDRIGIALIPALRQQRDMINDLKLELERIKEKIL